MSAKPSSASAAREARARGLRTWIEIDSRAARENCRAFRRSAGPGVKLWSVVKSNAYGHGLFAFSKIVAGEVDGFCVDSEVEGAALRRAGIRAPILTLGPTLSGRYADAAERGIAVTVSSFEALAALGRAKAAPAFHIKIDTGMHRQGFYPEDLRRVLKALAARPALRPKLKGIYTHFAAAKDPAHAAQTEKQLRAFAGAAGLFKEAGFKDLVRHASATGGTLLGKKYHLDAVRIGIGLYGYWPSDPLRRRFARALALRPVLSWRAFVSETKSLRAGDRVGYDLAGRAAARTDMAILPVGYWHGLPRALSGDMGAGEAVIGGKRARILGRVCMDISMVAAPRGAAGMAGATAPIRVGSIATLVGSAGGCAIWAEEQARKAGTTHYEFLTRLNPLMERIVV